MFKLKGRQEFFVFAELMLFIAAWVLGVYAAYDDYRVRTEGEANTNLASSSNFSGNDFIGPRGEFE